jgi:hypothetical protein
MAAEVDEEKLQKTIASASKHDEAYLFYLLGSAVTPNYQTQSAGQVQVAGKSFFEKLRSELRKEVCGKNGPYQALSKGLVAKKDLPKLVAIAILTGVPTLGGITVTYGVAAYLALLILKAGLGAYCSEEKHT